MLKNHLSFILINVLHNMRIKQSAIFTDDFTQSLNLDIAASSLNEKTESLDELLKSGYIQIDETGYIGLTQKGGQFWESKFLIDWNLYFEYGGQFIDDKEIVFFYAVNKKTIQLAINNSNGLFDDCTIKTAQNWQPIYWKKPFNGFYIEKVLDSELLPNFYEVLPNYCQHPSF